jgi:hypothetical protein
VTGVSGGEDDVAAEHSTRSCDKHLHLLSNDLHRKVLRIVR